MRNAFWFAQAYHFKIHGNIIKGRYNPKSQPDLGIDSVMPAYHLILANVNAFRNFHFRFTWWLSRIANNTPNISRVEECVKIDRAYETLLRYKCMFTELITCSNHAYLISTFPDLSKLWLIFILSSKQP